jgi:hypothetical protein
MEIDREVTPVVPGSTDWLDDLTDQIRKEGFKEPLTIMYDPDRGLALLGDGNHRLAAAKRLGVDNVPVHVVRSDLSAEAKAIAIADHGLEPKLAASSFPAQSSPSALGFNTNALILDAEVERAARYFSKFVDDLGIKKVLGYEYRHIGKNIPHEGATPWNFSQAVLMDTISENFKLAEKDAIRLAHMQTERTVLERSLNHPFFALYPTSYFFGKVIPETFRFIAYEPFGIRTGVGAEAFFKVKQNVALQSQYDPRMQKLWDDFGKSAIQTLISYISPGMPWEDLRSNLPPWAKAVGKSGFDMSTIMEEEFATMSPERWLKKFIRAGEEIGGFVEERISPPPAVPRSGEGSSLLLDELQSIAEQPAGGAVQSVPSNLGATKGTDLGPILSSEFGELQRILSGQ